MDQKKRVLLGMSGGTDSSVAAILLQEAGYEVTGVTFRFYELNDSVEYLEDARTLADRLGIEHIIYDARKLFVNRLLLISLMSICQGIPRYPVRFATII